MLMFLSLEEFTTPNTRVFISILVNLNSIVSTKERYDEFTVLLIFVLRNESSLKPKNILIICKNLSHIFFRWFRLQTEHTAKRIFRSTISIERRYLMFDRSAFYFFSFIERQFNTESIPKVSFSKIVSVVNITLSAEDIDRLA